MDDQPGSTTTNTTTTSPSTSTSDNDNHDNEHDNDNNDNDNNNNNNNNNNNATSSSNKKKTDGDDNDNNKKKNKNRIRTKQEKTIYHCVVLVSRTWSRLRGSKEIWCHTQVPQANSRSKTLWLNIVWPPNRQFSLAPCPPGPLKWKKQTVKFDIIYRAILQISIL